MRRCFSGSSTPFLPVRKPWPLRLAAVVVCAQLSVVVIYSNDLPGLLGAMVGFFGYVAVFHRGRWMKKVAAVLVFYPAPHCGQLPHAGRRVEPFLRLYRRPPGEPGPGWTESDWFWSTLIHTLSLLARLGFWVGGLGLPPPEAQADRREPHRRHVVDGGRGDAGPFVCIFIIIYFMPEEMAIVYPVCFASIFSSFGLHLCGGLHLRLLQDRYRAQALEKQSRPTTKTASGTRSGCAKHLPRHEEPPSGPPGPDRGRPGPPPGCPGSAGSIGGL